MASASFTPSCGSISTADAPFIWNTTRPHVTQPSGLRLAKFRRVSVDADGWIVDADCRAVRQGGCHSHMRKPWVPGEISKSWRRVVSLATHWGEGHHHFVLESLVGLLAAQSVLPAPASTWPDDLKIHVTQRIDFELQWLEVVARVPAAAVVRGRIFADVLYAPELGRCRTPLPVHVSWLHERVARALAFNASTTASKPSLLVVRRLTLGHAERKRAANLLGPVLAVTRPAAKRAGLSHVVHDDAALPLLWHQLAAWAAAAVVVAPTGAALVNLLAAPAAACVVELQPEPEGGRRGADDTYGKLARGLGLEHRRVTVAFEGERALAAASDAALRRGVDECALRRSQG